MFAYEILDDDGLIVLTESGHTTVDDYQQVAPDFFADVRSKGIRRILLDSREFLGWASKEAESMAFHSWMESRAAFDKIALLAHPGIQEQTERFREIFDNAGKDVRIFGPNQYEAAMEWIKADG